MRGWVDDWLGWRVNWWLAGWMGGWVKADAEVILYCTYGKNMFVCFDFHSIYCRIVPAKEVDKLDIKETPAKTIDPAAPEKEALEVTPSAKKIAASRKTPE